MSEEIKELKGSNSYKSKVDKQLKTQAIKKSIGEKAIEGFLGDSIKNAGSYFFEDILIPTLKDAFSEMLHAGIDRTLGIDSRRSGRYRRGGRRDYDIPSYRDYSRYSDRYSDRDRDRDRDRNTRGFDLDDIGFDRREDAMELIDLMSDIVDKAGAVSLADVADICGKRAIPSDDRYGWTSVSSARVIRRRGLYVVDMPRPRLID